MFVSKVFVDDKVEELEFFFERLYLKFDGKLILGRKIWVCNKMMERIVRVIMVVSW